MTSKNGLHVAMLGVADVLPYRALMLQAYGLAADAFTSTVDERAAQPLAWWEKRIASPDGLSQCYGAFDADDLVGTVALEYSPRAKTQHSAWVIGMYVKAEARRRGAGLLLMQAAIAAANTRPNLCQLRLTVTEGNHAALQLYERVGFVAWGTEPMAIKTSTGFKAKVHMALVLAGGEPFSPKCGAKS